LSGALGTGPRGARQFVGWIAAKRDEVRHLLRLNAIPLPNLVRPDARDSAGSHWVEDCRAWRGELKLIPIAARHQCGAASALFGSNCGGKKVICLEP
jgi:hypothetical protein